MLSFSQLYFKDLKRTYFCRIYVILWDFLEVKITKFLIPNLLDWLSAGRPDRSTVTEVSRPVWSTDVYRTCTQPGLVGRSTGGQPSRELCSLEMALVDRPVDRQRAAALCIQSSSTGRLTGGTTVIKMTVGPVDRAVDWKGKTALSCCQQADFLEGYK